MVQLNENSEFPTEVARLRVTDKDSSSFGIVEFSLDGLDGTQNNFEVIDDPNEVCSSCRTIPSFIALPRWLSGEHVGLMTWWL